MFIDVFVLEQRNRLKLIGRVCPLKNLTALLTLEKGQVAGFWEQIDV